MGAWQTVKRVFGAVREAIREAMADPLPYIQVSDEERKRQREVLEARTYYQGNHDVPLTDRQREYLGLPAGERFAANFCRPVVGAVVERLLVSGFSAPKNEALMDRAWSFWQDNRLDILQRRVYEAAVAEGECFLMVYWDLDRSRVRLAFHPRYTDTDLGGTGFGCWAVYPDNDPDQPMEYACKRWTETYTDEVGRKKDRKRLTVYYPERVEKYALVEGEWTPYQDEGDEGWPLPWLDASGQPLGIPVIHFRNPALRSEHWDAIPLQRAINKTILDALAVADTAGFRILVAQGFHPTTDGKPPKEDGANLLRIHPGSWVGNVPKDGGVDVVPPGDAQANLDVYERLVLTVAQVTDTPAARFQLTRQIAAEGTLKQQSEPLLAKVRARQVLFGAAWVDAIKLALVLANLYGSEPVDPTGTLTTTWEPAEARDEKEELESLAIKRKDLGVPVEKLWAEAGYSQEEIDEMKESPEYQARMAQMEMAIAGAQAMQQQPGPERERIGPTTRPGKNGQPTPPKSGGKS